MGDTVREAAATLASLLNAPSSTKDDDGNYSNSAGKKKSASSKKKNNATSKQTKSDINWGAILQNKELGDEWDYYYRRLEIFEQRYKHVRVPRDGKRDDLHDWIKVQKAKSAYLSEERVSALQIIGVLPTKLSHDLVYSNPPRPPKRRKEVELATPKRKKPAVKRKNNKSSAAAKQKQKEKPEKVNKKRAAEPNPYSNVDEDAREKSKASRADRANRRMGDFKIASVSPKSPAAVQQKQEVKPKVERKRVAEPNPYSTVDRVAAEKSKVSRADRAQRRMGHFRTAFISPR